MGTARCDTSTQLAAYCVRPWRLCPRHRRGPSHVHCVSVADRSSHTVTTGQALRRDLRFGPESARRSHPPWVRTDRRLRARVPFGCARCTGFRAAPYRCNPRGLAHSTRGGYRQRPLTAAAASSMHVLWATLWLRKNSVSGSIGIAKAQPAMMSFRTRCKYFCHESHVAQL